MTPLTKVKTKMEISAGNKAANVSGARGKRKHE
jgi:hypothetical protein